MSIEAINWVFNDAPELPARAFAVLMGLANHAAPDGTNAFAAQARLAQYARKSDRAVRDDLKVLLRLGLIKVSKDQGAVAHIRADVRPIVYELSMAAHASTTGSRVPGVSPEGLLAPGSRLPGVEEAGGSQVPDGTGSTVPGAPGSQVPGVNYGETHQNGTAPGSTASNARKQASDKPTTNQLAKEQLASQRAGEPTTSYSSGSEAALACHPLVQEITKAQMVVGWALTEAEWTEVRKHIERCGVDVLVDSASSCWERARAKPRYARYFLPAWRELPDIPRDDAGAPIVTVPQQTGRSRSTTDGRINDGLDLMARMALLDQAEEAALKGLAPSNVFQLPARGITA